MQFSSILVYFISITVYLLLSYNFLTTILFCFKKELLTTKKSIQRFQQFLLILLFVCMLVYHNITTKETAQLSIIPWVWGFLTGHIFSFPKKQYINELVGLGIVLAMTIVLFFKQTEIIELFTTTSIATMKITIYLLYMGIGFILGTFLWSNSFKK